MCLSPGEINGQKIGCRECWQCRSVRRNDVRGRLIAEYMTSPECHTVTLTYGGDDRLYSGEVRRNPHAMHFHYEDVQTWVKRLRNHSAGLRYFVAGENGPETGRVHWHGVVFWHNGTVPNIECGSRYLHCAETPEQAVQNGSRYSEGKPLWDHGWSYWQEGHWSNVGYAAKYVLKDLDFEAEDKVYGGSCMPPMGFLYFRAKAREIAAHGLAPQDLFYKLPGVTKYSSSKPDIFRLRGRSARHFLDEYLYAWRELHGNDNVPGSPLVERHLDDFYEREIATRRKVQNAIDRIEMQLAFQREKLMTQDKAVLERLGGREKVLAAAEIRDFHMRRADKRGRWLDDLEGGYGHLPWRIKDAPSYLAASRGIVLPDAANDAPKSQAAPSRSRKLAAKQRAYQAAMLEGYLVKAVTAALDGREGGK